MRPCEDRQNYSKSPRGCQARFGGGRVIAAKFADFPHGGGRRARSGGSRLNFEEILLSFDNILPWVFDKPVAAALQWGRNQARRRQ